MAADEHDEKPFGPKDLIRGAELTGQYVWK
jgi:hypothetical protein